MRTYVIGKDFNTKEWFLYSDEDNRVIDTYDTEEKAYENLAIIRAEERGVYSFEYNHKTKKMHYISYFGSEGFVKVTVDVYTDKETRKHQKTTKKEYNYFCG